MVNEVKEFQILYLFIKPDYKVIVFIFLLQYCHIFDNINKFHETFKIKQ